MGCESEARMRGVARRASRMLTPVDNAAGAVGAMALKADATLTRQLATARSGRSIIVVVLSDYDCRMMAECMRLMRSRDAMSQIYVRYMYVMPCRLDDSLDSECPACFVSAVFKTTIDDEKEKDTGGPSHSRTLSEATGGRALPKS